MKQVTENTELSERDAVLDQDELNDLGPVSKETRGVTWGGFEGPDCMPRRFAPNCP